MATITLQKQQELWRYGPDLTHSPWHGDKSSIARSQSSQLAFRGFPYMIKVFHRVPSLILGEGNIQLKCSQYAGHQR
jgi:hypothetical protein